MNEVEVYEHNTYDVSTLNIMRTNIENMSKFNQIEILRILTKNNDVTINENKYGIHINLTELSNDILDELKSYVNYVNEQEKQLSNIEKQQESYKNIILKK
jgi:hypothetical protein